jgi:DNA-binding MarR family transcriptional regulator
MLHDPDTVGHPEAARIMSAVERMLRLRARTWERLEPEVGINEAQAEILLAVNGGHRQVSSVAEASGRHVSTASRLIDQLVRSGHLDRVEDPDDRRAVLLSLTRAGTDAITTIETTQGRLLSAALDRLGGDGARRLADAMERLADAADEVGTHLVDDDPAA